LLDQTFASATTFFLTVVAAHSLGPNGLGAIALGLAATAIPLGLERACVIDPFVTRSGDRQSDAAALRAAVTVVALGGIAFSALFFVCGVIFSGSVGDGFRAFAPWIAPVSLQAMLRAAAYRRRSESAAAASSGTWGIVFVVAASGLGLSASANELVACWGVGAAAGTCVAVAVLRIGRPAGVTPAARWLISEALVLGRWLVAASTIYTAGAYASMAALATIVSPSALGGYRAIESAFSPLSLLAPGLTNPGLQVLRERVAREEDPRRLACTIGVFAAVVVAVYACVIWLIPDLISKLYGPDFTPFTSLILPIAVGQCLIALNIGFAALLRVQQRGGVILTVSALQSGIATFLAIGLGYQAGIEAAAWGIAAGSSVGVIVSSAALFVWPTHNLPEEHLRARRLSATLSESK
jgi:O-antigen/teichoic acid export membrane protein